MKVIEIEGKTVDDATKKGMAELHIIDSSKVEVEVIDQGRSGIFGFGVSKPAKIRIYFNENIEDVGNIAKDVLINIMKRMNIHGDVSDIKEGQSKVYIELLSKDNSGLIIGRKGKTL